MSVPSRVVTNHELATLMETSNEWIIERTGIEERCWVSDGETGTTLATAACQQAIERAGRGGAAVRARLDGIVAEAACPEAIQIVPGTSAMVNRERLALPDSRGARSVLREVKASGE
jgi:3-oxoacyl-[acyl-carrier-protein] synthase-3